MPQSVRQPAELDVGRALRLFWRAVRLRCPNCGGGSLFLSPLRLRPDCPTCGMQLDRGESDYFLGAYLLNLVAVELLFAVLFGVVLVTTWPSPPWELLQYGGAALMIVGAVACYPFTKVLWIAFDVALRPVEPSEMPGPLDGPLDPGPAPVGQARRGRP